MPFSPKSRSSFNRHHREEVAMSFSAMDCVLVGQKAIYVSTELTSGLRMYSELRLARVKTTAELKTKKGKTWYRKNIWDRNIEAAAEFARGVQKQSKNAPVVTPGPFEAPGWSQAEYLGFWEELIRTRIECVWFNKNWQYSNGCAFEFAVACHERLKTFDHEGDRLTSKTGERLLAGAVAELKADGFDVTKLEQSLRRIRRTLKLHQ